MPHLKPLAHSSEEVVHKRPLEHVHVNYAALQARQAEREREGALRDPAQTAKLQENRAMLCNCASHATPCLTKRPCLTVPIPSSAAPRSLQG